MAISKNNVKLQLTISKELDGWLNEIVKGSKLTPTPITKSQLTEVALREFIFKSMDKRKEN